MKSFFSTLRSAYTLVELIVVIAVLSILTTIAFVAYEWHNSSARDAQRMSDIKSLRNGLDVLQAKEWSYPAPEPKIPGDTVPTGTIAGVSYAYLGVLGDSISQTIGSDRTPTDPIAGTQYAYATSADGGQFQIATILEKAQSFQFVPITYASTASYRARVDGNYPGCMKFNIITSTGSDTWIANIPSIIWNNTGNVELFSTGGVYTNPAVFVTDKSSNLPYASGDIPLGSATTDSLIQEKTGFSSTSFTGVNISSILSVPDAFGQQLAVANFFGTGATPAAKVILNSCGGSIPSLQTFILGSSSDITTPTSVNHPTAPIASAATSITTTSITWNWQTSTGATRYELSADNTTWVDQGNVLTKTEVSLIDNTVYTRYVRACNAGGCSASTTMSATTLKVFICGTSTVTGRSPDTNVYQTVVGADGKCWLKSNLWTSNVATAYNDSNANAWLYQWGRLTDGHQIPTSGTTTSPSSTDIPGHANFVIGADWRSPQNDTLSTTWGGVNGANSPCPVDWRIPTQTEWAVLVSSAGITDYTTAFNSSLKLTVTGLRRETDAYFGFKTYGYYWSSSSEASGNAYYFAFSTGVTTSIMHRSYAYAVRCIKN